MMAISESEYCAVQVSKHAFLEHRLRGRDLEYILTVGPDPIRSRMISADRSQERPAVGVVRAHDDSPWILDQQVPLQADRPLHTRIRLVFLYSIGEIPPTRSLARCRC